MRKFYSILFATLLTSTSLFSQTFEKGNINYEVTASSEVKVIAKTPKYSGEINIPLEVTNGNATYTVKTIGEEAFDGCTGLTSVSIPTSVTTIGDWAFSGCTGLASVSIPASVTTIGEGAFNSCMVLTAVNIPTSVTTIGDAAFSSCTGLTSVTIPVSVTTISSYAFSGCTGLTSVAIPNLATAIGDGAFYQCRSLASVTIPASVMTIGDDAFSGCSGLKNIYALNSTPVDLESTLDVFASVSTDACTLHVPVGSVETYKAAVQWGAFTNIEGNAGAGTIHTTAPAIILYPNPVTVAFGIQGLGQVAKLQVYTLSGTQVLEKTVSSNEMVNVSSWSKGAYLVKINGTNTTKLVVK